MKKTFIKLFLYSYLAICISSITRAQEARAQEDSLPSADKKIVNADNQEALDEGEDYDEFDWATTSNYTSLELDWGANFLMQAPQKMEKTFWGSKSLGSCVYYNIPIKESHFLISAGLAYNHADYTFKNNYALTRSTSDRKKVVIQLANSLVEKTQKEIYTSSLSMHYVDFVLETRFVSNKLEPHEGFFVALGGNIGFQFSPSRFISYLADEEKKSLILKERFNLNKYHYGLHMKIGFYRFGLFYKQTISDLFAKNGPSTKRILPFTVGLSFQLFTKDNI